ncbi:MAG TPA: ABC transporter substrate-binding protein [Micromonosporaceae bacterium]|nr:ABC transporter substrate-binding protein [Micromonosporaceae bacterium]
MLKPSASRVAALTVGAALLLTAAGCGTDESDEPTGTQKVRLYGTDGNMLNTFHEEFADQANLLNGMKGTAPATPLTDDFKNRLQSVSPNIDGYAYAAETYDAIIITALAAELARSDDPADIAAQINGVTVGGQSCTTVQACLSLARSGNDIRYRGPSLRGAGFTEAGEPATASYATLHFDRSGKINEAKTEYLGAGNDSAATDKEPPRPQRNKPGNGARLKLGELLPRTGDLSLAYPPMAAGAALALKEINNAGGVFGKPVLWVEGDDGTNPDVAKATVQNHIDAGVQVIIGAGASGISRAVLPDVVEAGLILFSSSNTDAGLSTVEDKGLYFRSAPPDNLQGRALADVILRDGPQKIVIVARNDSYGVGLQDNVRAELERTGIGADRIKLMTYEPPASGEDSNVDFSTGAEEIKQYGPEAVLIIGFAESAGVIKALAASGVEIQH